ncbi:uncharacterized protein FIBRA_09527 [Fibroporia radiculosa]|uniref:Uncharacterized protein n=1 Tax=Fibroporia radiculosa TaxID=599839 RepID=J7SCI1_9APHY|nr:uncharacterized protein FIBRA_09527 [Fibroporia radiculosa]CCM07186.1 predicted protein [Fibroporia radiculosa]
MLLSLPRTFKKLVPHPPYSLSHSWGLPLNNFNSSKDILQVLPQKDLIVLPKKNSTETEEVQASALPTPSSPHQPIPIQWFLRRVTESPELVKIARSASKEEL